MGKTATNPIFFEIPYSGVNPDMRKIQTVSKLLPYKDWLIHNEILDAAQGPLITFIRNPFDRVILHYKEQCETRKALIQYPISFGEWCKKCYDPDHLDRFLQNNPKEFLSQRTWLKGGEERIEVIRIDSDSDAEQLPPFIKSVQTLHRGEYYDRTAAGRIKSWYRDDFEYFNFDVDWQN